MTSQNSEKYLKLKQDLQDDLRNLSSETRRKFPQIRDSCEAVVVKLRSLTTASGNQDPRTLLQQHHTEIVQPFMQACYTKQQKTVLIALGGLQKLITYQVLGEAASESVVRVLWELLEANLGVELKLLQTAILLITMNANVKGRALAQAMVICFRLHFTKNATTNNTAAATIRQIVSTIFERMVREAEQMQAGPSEQVMGESDAEDQHRLQPSKGKSDESMDEGELSRGANTTIGREGRLSPCAQDAYNLFQDLCHLLNGDSPVWLQGLHEMTRTLGLELLDSILQSYPQIFKRYPEFACLLKERVCPLIIRLFSPSIKLNMPSPPSASGSGGAGAPGSLNGSEKPSFPIVLRLIRIVLTIVQRYLLILNTESEIFLSILLRFLEPDKPMWHQVLSLEVLGRLASQPHLIEYICHHFDLTSQTTKVFTDFVNAVSNFIRSSLLSHPAEGTAGGGSGGQGVGGMRDGAGSAGPGMGGVGIRGGGAGFICRGHWTPLMMNPKVQFVDMLDKTGPDAPVPADGYALSVAFLTLIDLVRSVQVIVEGTDTSFTVSEADLEAGDGGKSAEEHLDRRLMDCCWQQALGSLTLLLEASTDEGATEIILKSVETMIGLSGRLKLTLPRDAFIMALCKASLPASYGATVLGHAAVVGSQKGQVRQQQQQPQQPVSSSEEVERSQVVVVGMPMPTPLSSVPSSGSTGSNGGSNCVMLTAKNIQCMKALLTVAHCHGPRLETAWHLVLTTLQHLAWVLGLRPAAVEGAAAPGEVAAKGVSGNVSNSASASSGGGSSGGGATGGTVLTTAVMADIPILTQMLSKLFESSQHLDEVSLHHLIDGLCKLSSEAMETAYAMKEPSLFPVAKLVETGLVNVPRLEVYWRPMTAHMLEVCQHSHAALRAMAADAVVALVRRVISGGTEQSKLFWESARLSSLVLHPLVDLSATTYADVRQKQVDCVQHILHSCTAGLTGQGESRDSVWLELIGVIGAVKSSHSDQQVRNAYQSFQLVVTDFLPCLPSNCREECVRVAARFAHQREDMNIALTAIGSIWHITDFFSQHHSEEQAPSGCPDQLWICVQTHLAELCVDPRPAVRKSAGQTLFNSLDSLPDFQLQTTWTTVLWKVLFPLLDSVHECCTKAPEERQMETGNLLMHHSRDTAAKQWAETQVLTLSGVAHVFTTKANQLLQLEQFPRAWKLLLEHIETAALSPNAEIALNALKSYQEILKIDEHQQVADPKARHASQLGEGFENLWAMAWQTWLRIGLESMLVRPASGRQDSVPQQKFLTLLFELFPHLLARVRHRFARQDFHKFCSVLKEALTVPISAEAAPFILPPTYQETHLTSLQETALATLDALRHEVVRGPAPNLNALLADLFRQLLDFGAFAVQTPSSALNGAPGMENGPGPSPATPPPAMNFVTFGERCLQTATDLYKECAGHRLVLEAGVMEQMVRALAIPLGLKYRCPSQTTWQLCSHCLTTVLSAGVPLARRQREEHGPMWEALAACFNVFVFAKHKYPPGLSVEEFLRHEALDCGFVRLIRDQFLHQPEGVPDSFVEAMIEALNSGSIHNTSSHHWVAGAGVGGGLGDGNGSSDGASSSLLDFESCRSFREQFAQLCFETLLDYSFNRRATPNGSQDTTVPGGPVNRVAIRAILQRCRAVLSQYLEDERLSGKCPLPRARLSEVSFVLKAMTTLLSTFKNSSPLVDEDTWSQVIDIYPLVVDCVMVSSGQFMKVLRDVLHQYKTLLRPGC